MANDNNNKKELVDIDDDPTEELEALKLVQKDVPGNDNASNSDTARKLKVLTELGSGANDNSDDIPLLGVKDALSMPAPGGNRSQIERELEQHDRALFERDRLIAELEDRIREYDETITQLEDQAGIRNGSNEDLADRARELDETIAELEDQLVMRDETIAELERKADIARVLEAGSKDGPRGVQPYFAMEYIDGRTLTAWAIEEHGEGEDSDEEEVSTEE